jgi:hypothetical protein
MKIEILENYIDELEKKNKLLQQDNDELMRELNDKINTIDAEIKEKNDLFKLKLDEIVVINGDGYNIDKEVLDEINKEYQLFATQKLIQIKMVKDFSSKMVKNLEELQLPCLEHFLSTKYAFSSSKYVCEFCEYVAKNQSAMSAHKRGCKGKITSISELVPELIPENNIILFP